MVYMKTVKTYCCEDISKAKKGKPIFNRGKHWKLVDGKRVYY